LRDEKTAKRTAVSTTYSGGEANNPDRDIYASAQNAGSGFNYAQHQEYAAKLPACVRRFGWPNDLRAP
jgi:hypothetical protein